MNEDLQAPISRTSLTGAVPILVLALVVLASLSFLSQWPREPRMLFKNDGYRDIDHLKISIGDQTTDLGPLKEGRSMTLPVKLPTARVVKIQGKTIDTDELSRITQIAKDARRDVHVGIDYHGCLTLEGWEIH